MLQSLVLDNDKGIHRGNVAAFADRMLITPRNATRVMLNRRALEFLINTANEKFVIVVRPTQASSQSVRSP